MRLIVAGGALLAMPHVAGFALRATSRQAGVSPLSRPSVSSLQRRTAFHATLCRCRASSTPTLSERESAWPCSRQAWLGRRRHRKRPLWAARASSSSSTAVMAMPSLPTPETASDHHQPSTFSGTEQESPGLGLRLAVVGAQADELGFRIAERYGLATTSMDELMQGRRGRKTDAVRARAASQWLEDNGATGVVLTGFPTTTAETEALEKQGVVFAQLLVVHDALEGELYTHNGKDDVDLLSGYSRRVVSVATQEDVEKLCESAARTLALTPLGEREPEPSAARTAGSAPPPSMDERTNTGGPSEQAEEEASLLASMATMSPSEHMRLRERDPVAYEAAGQQARKGAEAKRAEKEEIKRKKRMANEAQQLDTPFYVAVAQSQPKARFRPPVPTIPSRITERLSSAVAAPEGGVANTRLEFGPLVLDSPASDCLLAAGITEPTGIQKAGMGPILNGESVILHAMTGSGKTLTFLLPLMQRWTPGLFSPASGRAPVNGGGGDGGIGQSSGEGAPDGPFRILLALPTRELAVQVAREVVLLTGGLTSSVELLVDSSVFHDLSSVTAPIVVGSAKVLERLIRKSRPTVRAEVLPRVKCLVVDEVDRLVDVLSKHAPPREVEKRKRHARPIAALLERVLQATPDAQVVACSATIGRPLRRELGHIVRRSSALGSAAIAGVAAGSSDGEGGGDSRELRVIRDTFAASSVENPAVERAVAIPDTIRHYCVPLRDGDFFSRLEGLTAAVRELQPRRPLIFIPPDERVTAVVAHLRRSGGEIGRRAVALHEAMGFVSDEERGGVRGLHASEAIEQHDKLAEQFRGGGSNGGGDPGVRDDDLLAGSGAQQKRLGEGEAGALLVTGEDSARGLHFDDVDFVFLMQKPKSPDEYVHLAGRTGRQGKTGTVVSLVAFEEFRKLQSWSSSLKIHFEPLDILQVVKGGGGGGGEGAVV